jgi:hypothetical protein
MTTRREQILSTWAAALAGMPQVSGRIWRSRVEPLQRHESPGIALEWIDDDPDVQTSLPYLDWTLMARAVVIVRDTQPDVIADPIVAEIHRRTMASTTLRDLTIDLRPGRTTCELLQADSPAGLITMPFVFVYRTTEGDLELV